jgi:hypothetical protein
MIIGDFKPSHSRWDGKSSSIYLNHWVGRLKFGLSSFSTLPYPSIPYAIAARRLDLLEDLARRIQDKGGNALAIAQIKT